MHAFPAFTPILSPTPFSTHKMDLELCTLKSRQTRHSVERTDVSLVSESVDLEPSGSVRIRQIMCGPKVKGYGRVKVLDSSSLVQWSRSLRIVTYYKTTSRLHTNQKGVCKTREKRVGWRIEYFTLPPFHSWVWIWGFELGKVVEWEKGVVRDMGSVWWAEWLPY